MRKSVVVILSLLALATGAMAQTTVMGSKTLDNTYVGVNLGILAPMTSNSQFLSGAGPVLALELGKNITPVVGLSIEAIGAFGTTDISSPFTQTNLVANLKLNLSNWMDTYPGEPREFEISFVPAIGWGHDMAVAKEFDPNYFTFDPHFQLDYNFGKDLAWQVNFKPGFVWRTRAGFEGFANYLGAYQILAGVTYKFASQKTGSHNFVKNPNTINLKDYLALRKEYKAALLRIDELERQLSSEK